jgi:hypothetical protein
LYLSLRPPATVLIHPKGSSMRLRIRWLIWWPAWRVVRPSMALRRLAVFWATWAVIFSSRQEATKAAVS